MNVGYISNPDIPTDNNRAEKKKLSIDPFVVFCEDHRKQVVAENANLSSCEITSILGIMWRSLDPQKKKSYFEIARAYSEYEKVNKKKKRIRQKKPTREFPDTNPIKFPSFHIVPRSCFGLIISDISKNIVEKREKT